MANDDKNEPENAAPTMTHLVNVQLFPTARVVRIVAREKFAIAPHETTLSFDTIEGLFLTILNLSLQARGVGVALAPVAPPSTAPPS